MAKKTSSGQRSDEKPDVGDRIDATVTDLTADRADPYVEMQRLIDAYNEYTLTIEAALVAVGIPVKLTTVTPTRARKTDG